MEGQAGGPGVDEDAALLVPRVGAMLRAIRRAAGLSLNGVARTAGVDPAYLHRIETDRLGERGAPRRGLVLALGRALGLDDAQVDDLLVRAGYSPEALRLLGGWDPTLADVAATLADPALPAEARADLRVVLRILCARWRDTASPPPPPEPPDQGVATGAA